MALLLYTWKIIFGTVSALPQVYDWNNQSMYMDFMFMRDANLKGTKMGAI